MTIKEFLEFISQDANHFIGFLMVLIIATNLIITTLKYIFKKK